MRTRWLMATLALTGCGEGQSRRAENVPVEALPTSVDTVVAAEWINIPEAAWLGGRRWAVIGVDHDAVSIVDFGAKALNPIAKGDTAMLAKPYGLFTAGDTIFVLDWAKRWASKWTFAAQTAGNLAAPNQTRGVLPRARDAAGQYYFEIAPLAGPNGDGLRDSAVIVRSDPAMTKFDTVARLSPPDVAEIIEKRGKRLERLVFSGLDSWGVRPNGQLWVARVRRNEVWTYAGGKKPKKGERLPDPVLEVTRADREQHIASFPEDLRSIAQQQMQFAPLKPPFDRALGGPDGAVWLRKSKALTDSIRRYHVVDTTGALNRVFTTLGNGQIVAVGTDAVLMAEQFRGGIRLMEVRVPAPPPPSTKP